MTVVLIAIAYVIISAVEILVLSNRKKLKREIFYYIIFMFISMVISEIVATKDDIPSIASIIASVFSPIIKK